MAIHRLHKNGNYTIVSNYHLRDKELSCKAKGLLTTVLSLPDTWNFSVNGLDSILKEGKTAIRSMLSELEELGYLVRSEERDSSGRICYAYDWYETPEQKPYTENLHTVDSYTVKRTQLNTEQLSTEQLSTEDNCSSLFDKCVSIDKKKSKEKKSEHIPYSEVVDYLNLRTGKSYKSSTPKTRELIRKRFHEGFTLDDFRRVIDTKVSEWSGDPVMSRYLRPQTLFGTKFESYLQQDTSLTHYPPKRRKITVIDASTGVAHECD